MDTLKKSASEIKKTEDAWDTLPLLLGAGPGLDAMAEVHQKLVQYAKSSKSPQDLAELVEATDAFVTRAKIIADAIKTIKEVLKEKKPLFGICLGHQLLALANDILTFKMHHGHRGLNHPVKNVITGLCEITTQNHGFGVDPDAVRKHPNVIVSHVNLNDDSIEGIKLKDRPAFSVQYHPEATPGPHDSRYLFDDFVSLMKSN